jgi:threonine synthase
MIQDKFIYRCTDCGTEYEPDGVRYLCSKCAENNSDKLPPKGVLKVIYDYFNLKSFAKSNLLFEHLKEDNYIDLLPVFDSVNFPKLKVGNTPFYKQTELNGKKLAFHLYLKDDSQNPTYSFKDRASYLVSAYAKENGINTIVAASTGNAGSSLAGICASQGQKAIIMIPEAAPLAKLTQILMYGAKIVPVKGTYDDAFDLSIAATEKYGWYNRNTAFNPLTVEGKKTVSFEIYNQLNQIVPDRIFVPVGDGVIISGVYKGFEDLLELGIIDKMPVIVAVQSEGSDNIVRNMINDEFNLKPSHTIADSISVDIPRNFYMAKQFLKKYNGEYLTVSDNDIINASDELSKNTGLFAEPAAAAAFAGMIHYANNNMLSDSSHNVVLLTGSGLKDLKSVQNIINMPKAVEPDINLLNHLVN